MTFDNRVGVGRSSIEVRGRGRNRPFRKPLPRTEDHVEVERVWMQSHGLSCSSVVGRALQLSVLLFSCVTESGSQPVPVGAETENRSHGVNDADRGAR